MQLLDLYPAHPGCCLLCRDCKTPVYDTNIEDDWTGRVYICHECVGTLAQGLDWWPPGSNEQLQRDLDDAKGEITRLNGVVQLQADTIQNLTSIREDLAPVAQVKRKPGRPKKTPDLEPVA